MNTKLQVLVIDDDAVVGRSFDRVLTDKGYEVNTAVTGEEALKDMESKDYDVVFTDIKMPGMDGIEVAERIKAKCPWTPVVVITGYGTKENEARASVLGVNGFVRKPLTPAMIENITLKALQDPVEITTAANEPEALVDITAAANEPEIPVVITPEARSSVLRTTARFAKNVGLFIAAPFIALAYIIALPAVGFFMFGKLAYEAYQKRKESK